MPQTEYAIQLEHVTKTFGPVIANHDVTMNIRRGEILSLLGENGSGKTCLLYTSEYQMLRTAALDIITELGIEGGCNCQFALKPDSFELSLIHI